MDNLNTIIISLGTNKGNRFQNLKHAWSLITERGIVIGKVSSVYETEAWGIQDQPNFFNQVMEIHSSKGPNELLNEFLEIESKMGRQRLQKWGERIIDLDILYFNDQVIDQPELKIPHPEIPNRRFVLVPLTEIIPGWRHPVSFKTPNQLLNECDDKLGVSVVNL